MRLLAIDCSTEALSVAAGDAANTTQRHGHAGQSHSRLALAWIDEVLAARGWRIGDLDGIAFGAGPGTFTGIRIACGIAQGLALGAGIAVVAVPTLEAIAQQAFRVHGATRVLACLDARMREVYIAAHERTGDCWQAPIAPTVIKPDELELPAGEWFGAGGGFAAYPDLAKLERLSGVDPSLEPVAPAIVALAESRLRSGEGVDAAEALPLYVRHRVALTSAERAAGERL
jgi:tRNA threonylcarbamoyladenosine biosynthesis protein TsaB